MGQSRKWRAEESQMGDSSEGGEDPAVDDRRRCENNSFVLSCIGKRTKKVVSMAAKTVTAFFCPLFYAG